MKKSIKLFLILFGLLFSTAVFAQDPFFIEGEVTVPSNCEIADTDGKLHVFPKENSPDGLLGICAIVAAKDAGIIESFTFIDFGFGLFLDSINGVKTSEDWDLSWSLYHNGKLADVGLADLVVTGGNEISLIYTSYSSKEEFDKLVLNVVTSPSQPSPGASSGGSTLVPQNPNIEKAVQFLVDKQSSDGSIENPMFTDWAALALATYFSVYNPEHSALINLKNYFLTNPDPGKSLGSPVLGFIRRAMALMSLGVDPYSGTSINYIQEIVDSFDGEQIGDENLVNDDIFALLVLRKAGFDAAGNIIQETANFILANQRADGSWTGSVDMTSAAIQALALVTDVEGASRALQEAKIYLQSRQQADGGFGNPDSTSWAMQAIAALQEDWRDWKKNGKAPGDYLLFLQKYDGSIESPLPVWSTAFAVPAAYGKTWSMILNSFPRTELEFTGQETFVFEGQPAVAGASTEALSEIYRQLERIEQELGELELEVKILFAKKQLEQIIQTAETLQRRLETLGVENSER